MKRFFVATWMAIIALDASAQLVTKSNEEQHIGNGIVYSAEYRQVGVAAAGQMLIGFTTTARPMVALDRGYSSTESSLTVELYEVTFTGGTNVTMYNRNQVIGGVSPILFKSGVTATLVTPITSRTFIASSSTGSATVAISTDASVIILKPSTSYVVRIVNNGATAATMGAGFTYRELLPTD